MANDVEENPGPTLFGIVDPTRTICAEFSQANARNLDSMLVNNVWLCH